MTFVIAYCYNIWLLSIVANLLLCLLYKLTFIIGMYREKQYMQGLPASVAGTHLLHISHG